MREAMKRSSAAHTNARTACVVCLLLLWPGLGRAETLSRGGAIELALSQNPRVAAARAVESQAEARRSQVQAARLPSITATVGVGPSLKARLVPGSGVESTENAYGDVGLNDLSVGVAGQVEVTQPLYTFGKLDERWRATGHEIQARRAQGEMTRAELAKSVAEIYEGWLTARDAERFFDEAEHWLARTIEDTELAIKSDSQVTEQDLLRLQAGMAALRLGSNQARTGRRQAEAGLVAYLALPTGTPLAPKEDSQELLPSTLPDTLSLIALARERRPELRALSSGSLAYRALADAEAAGNLPDFFAYASVRGAYTAGRDLAQSRYVYDPLGGYFPVLLLGARWQVTGTMASGRADEQRAMASELEHQGRWAAMGLAAEVTKAFEDIQRAKGDVEQAAKGIKVSKEWLVRASADFSIGLGSSKDVADASQAYVQLRVAALDAAYRHNVALAELARATGTLGDSTHKFYPTQKE